MQELVEIAKVGGTPVILVGAFLWYLAKRDKASRAIADSCHAAHERTTKMACDATESAINSVNDCKETIGANTEVMREATKVLRRMNGDHERR